MYIPLEFLVGETDGFFDRDIRLPRDEVWESKIKNCPMNSERSAVFYDYRRWQAKKIGFRSFHTRDIIESLMGSKITHNYRTNNKTNYDWVYNHYKNKNDKSKWVRPIEYWERWERNSLFTWPPLCNKLVWRCRMIRLNELESEMPNHVILKILELKILNIFNCFHIIEPILPPKPPVLLGAIWEMPLTTSAGKTIVKETGMISNFFICGWL